MGSRDHAITCATCGVQRGGINDDKCMCDSKSTEALMEAAGARNFVDECSALRDELLKHERAVRVLLDGVSAPTVPINAIIEVRVQAELALRAIEDAHRRLGKVIQNVRGGAPGCEIVEHVRG